MTRNFRITAAVAVLMASVVLALFEYNKSTDEYLYGSSYRQNKLVNTVRLHKYGITGKGIKIGIIDAGFCRAHPAFGKTKILKEFDFVTGKTTTSNYDHIKGMDHGTNVLSVAGGYKTNELIGIAYGAGFLLAKTDISPDRLAEEEINAVKASRWLYENGAQIITTSLSFNKFDNADYYSPSQMNGGTALITRTADSLAGKGVVFVSSAGNNYENVWHIIESPADGFKVLAAGSIDKNSEHSFFSSCGPTADGRIKPDIVTPGEGVWAANYLPKIRPEFGWNHGTSLSAPIAAGIAALVLSAHPELSSGEVIEAIKKTSSKAGDPDNLYGWGIPDAEKAVSYFGPAFSNSPEVVYNDNKLMISTYLFSSYGILKSEVELHLVMDEGSWEKVYMMTEEDDNFYTCSVDAGSNKGNIKFYFKAKDARGISTKYPSGILGEYFAYKK